MGLNLLLNPSGVAWPKVKPSFQPKSDVFLAAIGYRVLTWGRFDPQQTETYTTEKRGSMHNNPFEELQFDRRRLLRLSPRAVWVLAVVGLYIAGWWLLPPSVLFWLGLPLFVGLAWAASYSRKEVIQTAIDFLHQLDRF